MAGRRVCSLTVKTQQTTQSAFGPAMAVGRICDGVLQVCFESLQYRTFQIGSQQCAFDRIVLTLLLRQQKVILLKNGIPDCPLNFRTQVTFAIKALVLGGAR
ncbi:hypothetical protein D3C85_1193100 [compost metagenome]